MTASRRYKEIVAGIAEIAEELREQDHERARSLARQLVAREAEMLSAGERATLTGMNVALHWEAAMEALWVESWMTLRPRPAPDRTADPAALEDRDAEVVDRSAALQEAVRRRFGLPRRA